MAVVAYFVSKEFHVRAWNNVMGYQKIGGEWHKTMMPDHHTFVGTVFCYYMGAAVVIAAIWIISSVLLLHYSININTGLQLLIDEKFVIFKLKS
ncbi:MAG: hypothetical protein PHW24_03720 [Candidatus Moranbacteria bacterium]|nr:hypothetical protein [Candidatus Moranbacteria bacterium]